MVKYWKKEVARDALALGSIPFYVIVIVRAIIGKYTPFIYHLLIAWLVLVVFSKLVKNVDQYLARGFVLVIFTSLFYDDVLYTVFALALFGLMIASSFYLKAKPDAIGRGVGFGLVASVISYYITSLII